MSTTGSPLWNRRKFGETTGLQTLVPGFGAVELDADGARLQKAVTLRDLPRLRGL